MHTPPAPALSVTLYGEQHLKKREESILIDFIPNTPIAPPRLAGESEEAVEEELHSLNSHALTVREEPSFEEDIAPLGFPLALFQVQEVNVYSMAEERETVSVQKGIFLHSGSC